MLLLGRAPKLGGMYDGLASYADDLVQLLRAHLVASAEAQVSQEPDDDLFRHERVLVLRRA